MATHVETEAQLTAVPEKPLRRVVSRTLRAHAFVAGIVAAALIGGGLRFIPTSTAATPGAAGQGAAAATACAAT